MRHSLLLSAVLLCLSGIGARAQTASQQQIPDMAARTQEQVQNAAAVAAEAKNNQIFEGGTVTYEDVLKDPDNAELNAAYVKSLIKQGDFLSAATTLERIMLTHPNAVDVKLLYGFVLFRLDDSVTAKSVLNEIDPEKLSPDQLAERDNVLAQIESRNKRLHQTLTVAFGGHWDSDKNAAPLAGDIIFSNAVLSLSDRARVQKDYGFLSSSIYDADYDLGLDTKTSVFSTVNFMRDQQITAHQFDTMNGGMEVGIRHEQGPWRVQTGIFTSQMNLMGQYFMNDYGIELHPTRRIDGEWDVVSDLRFERQAYHDVTADSLGPDNSGITSSGWLGPVWHITPQQKIALSTGIVAHDASDSAYGKYQTNTRYGLRLNDTMVLDKGQFLVVSAEMGDTVFAQANSEISNLTRHDGDERFGITYGTPLTNLGAALDTDLPPEFGSIVLTLHQEYYREFSTLMNYRYANYRTDAVLSKRWEF